MPWHWFDELDDPPAPDQIQAWASIRAAGRRRYVWGGVLWIIPVWVGIWVAANLFALWLFGKGFDPAGWSFLLIGPVSMWFSLSSKWRKNEQKYRAATGEKPGESPGVW